MLFWDSSRCSISPIDSWPLQRRDEERGAHHVVVHAGRELGNEVGARDERRSPRVVGLQCMY